MLIQDFALRRNSFCIILTLLHLAGAAQTLGGKAAYTFLKLPSSPLLAAAGGVNVSYRAGEVGLTAGNPALLGEEVSKQINTSFNGYLAGINAYSLTGAWHAEKLQTSFGGHVQYLDYGTLPATDAAGNTTGTFRPVDFVVQVSAARKYLEKWNYGLSLKLINSSYGQYRSTALAADVGLHYHDTARNFSASVVVKNMGGQLTTYAQEGEELPFDLQAGVTKRLANAPFGFSLTAQHLQTFDLLYNDTTFTTDVGRPSTSAFSKIATHLVAAAHVYAGGSLEATIGYSFLRRRELNIGNGGNGLAGFSAGLRLRLAKLQVLYARSAFQRGVAANQIGVTLHLDKLFGLGR